MNRGYAHPTLRAYADTAGADVRAAQQPEVMRAPAHPGAGADLLLVLVERLAQLVVEEIAQLKAHRLDEVPRFTERKGHLLLEIMRHGRGLPPGPSAAPLASAVRRLRAVLETDRRLLESHMKAASETAAIIARALADQEAAGTYSFTAAKGVSYR